MEKLRQMFMDTGHILSLIAKKLSEGQLLTQEDCLEAVRQINGLSQEQQRLVQEMKGGELDATGCTYIGELEEMWSAHCRREQERQRILQLRAMTDRFLSIRAVLEEYGEELKRVQSELSAYDEGELLRLDRDGLSELYQRFISCVGTERPGIEEVRVFKERFGYPLAFALLEHGLELGEMPSDTVPAPGEEPVRCAGQPAPASGEAEPVQCAGQPLPASEDAEQIQCAGQPVPAPEDAEPVQRGGQPSDVPEDAEPVQCAEQPVPAPEDAEQIPCGGQPAAVSEETEPVQCAGQLEPMLPIKKRDANVGVFKHAVKSLPVEARILLPALSHMGVLNVEMAVRFSVLMGWDVTRPDLERYTEQIRDTFRILSEKGFVAGYRTQEYGALYCLTEYGYDCLHKHKIMKDSKNLFFVPAKQRSFYLSVGSYRLLGCEEMDEEDLLSAFARNLSIERYLTCLQERREDFRLSEQDQESINQSLCWKNDQYVIKVPVDGRCVLCRVCCGTENPGGGAVLFLTPDRPENPWEEGPVAFCDGRELFYWKDRWVSAADAPEPIGVSGEEERELGGAAAAEAEGGLNGGPDGDVGEASGDVSGRDTEAESGSGSDGDTDGEVSGGSCGEADGEVSGGSCGEADGEVSGGPDGETDGEPGDGPDEDTDGKEGSGCGAAGGKSLPVSGVRAVSSDALEDFDISLYTAGKNAGLLLRQKSPVQAGQLLELTVELIAENRIPEALTLAETLAKAPGGTKTTETFYQVFRQSVQAPGSIYRYSSDVINQQQRALPEEDPGLRTLQQTMVLSILLWAMTFPTVAYDNDLYNNAGMFVSASEDQILQSLIDLLSTDFKKLSVKNDGLGFSPAVISGLIDNGSRERQVVDIRSRASVLKRTPTSTIKITGLETCLKQMVGPKSKIGGALSWVEENSREKADAIRIMLKEELGEGFWESDDVLENYIDTCWDIMRGGTERVRVKRLDNDTPARRLCKKALTDRIAVIKDWLDIVQTEQGGEFQKLREEYARILSKLKALLRQLLETIPAPAGHALAGEGISVPETGTGSGPDRDPYVRAGENILRQTAEKMLAALERRYLADESHFCYPLYLTPELMLGENGENLIVSELYGIAGLEPWSFVLRAVDAGQEDPKEILERINDYQDGRWYRNFGNEALLYAYLGEIGPDRTQAIQDAQRAAEQSVQAFESRVRLDRAYGKIQEHEMETVFSALDLVKNVYFQSHNYASFNGFIGQLTGLLERETEVRAARYEKQIAELEDRFSGTEMLEVARRALENRNFNSVDSYINQLENGILELFKSDRDIEQKTDFFAQFQDCEEGYYDVCQNLRNRSDSLAKWGERALESMGERYQHWTSMNEKKKGGLWLNSWIVRKDDSDNSFKVKTFLSRLGFTVKSNPERDDRERDRRVGQCEVFRVSLEKTSAGLRDYPHPIYKFGTELSDPMYVVCLYGCKGASTLIDIMTSRLQLSGPTIVLMDGSLTVTDRKQVASQFKSDTSGRNTFLLIDRVLMLYLASLDEGDRMKAMLHCTLPYTFELLYGNGSGSVPEEMFIGRSSEIIALSNPQGPSLVYGGRQLGKTALLSRVSKTLHNPQNKEYSFCVDVKDKGSEVLLEKVNRQLQKLELLGAPCTSLENLCETLQGAYDTGKIHRLQIFVDEADEFFRELNKNDFKALYDFRLLRDNTGHHVKFVFAGTHNVAATDKADMENNNLIHMGKPLCIEPLSANDAVKLIRIPMSYLGFEIGDAQIELILSNTNSYPGLIHMFCNALVQSVCENYKDYYSGQEAKKNPPYHVSDEQMRAVFKDQDIRKEIGTRVMATIKLNQEYKVISCLLAHMIYEDQESERGRLYGHSARELLSYNRRELGLTLLEKISEKNLEALLDEMAHMGILWKNGQTGQFRFRQQDFLNHIGTSEQVLEQLLAEDMGGGL